MSRGWCPECFEKQRTIDLLQEEVRRLKQQLRYRERQTEQGPFGSSTPSSKIPIKANSPPERCHKQGGANPGHVGHGRAAINAENADRVEEVELAAQICPECGGLLEDKGFRERAKIDTPPFRAEHILCRIRKKYCPRCHKTVEAKAPGLLPRGLFGNQLIAQAMFQHYVHGIPLGRICSQLGISVGSLIDSFHRVASLFDGLIPHLIGEYRRAQVRHADETSWRTDGRSGYAWIFISKSTCLFLFRSTRSAQVPKEVLGEKPLAGVLVVDRYASYNGAPCALQYCYAHLKREAEDLERDFPESGEVRAFTSLFIPLLSSAMHLHSQELTDAEYYHQAGMIEKQIIATIDAHAQHQGIRRIQDIFREKAARLYHWARNRLVPADNNRAERELRPTVIARKVSFGSQSAAGAKTREVLMSLVHTIRLRSEDPQALLKSALDKLASNPNQDPLPLLFPTNSS